MLYKNIKRELQKLLHPRAVATITLDGKRVDENTFSDFDVTVTDEEVALAKKLATEAVIEEGYKLK